MSRGAAFRGQPLLLLSGLLLGWLVLRVALWQPPTEPVRPFRPMIAISGEGHARATAPTQAAGGARLANDEGALRRGPASQADRAPELFTPKPVLPALWRAPGPPVEATPLPGPMPATAPESLPPVHESPRAVVGHNLLLVAGLSQMQVPQVLLAYLQAATAPMVGVPAAVSSPVGVLPRPAAVSSSRWSVDGWLLLRRDTTQSAAGPIPSERPTYGRSQAGAVVRYSLAPASQMRPLAHLRVSAALAGARERELAGGVSVRPLAGAPVRLVAEARANDTARGTRFRPAAYAVTEFPPLELPLGARGEAYIQGGYVGGAFATAFVDGQARVERPLVRTRGAEVSTGVGAWGGAQRGSARLDIGPTAAVSFRLGEARGRLAADYRFRIAGEAEPASGPAVTVSAGF